MWENMFELSTPGYADRSGNSGTRHLSGHWSSIPRRILHVPLSKCAFFPRFAERWLPKLLTKWCHHLNHSLTCAIFMHPNTRYQTLLSGNIPHVRHCQSRTTQLIKRKCYLGCWFVAALSYVHSHSVAKSCKSMPSHKMQT